MNTTHNLNVGKIVGAYVLVALAWIFSSDYITDTVLRRPEVHTYKGTAFVLVTAALLWLVLGRASRSIRVFQAELLASRERFRHVIENAPDAILIQTGGIVRYANPATAKLLGRSPADDLAAQPVSDLIHPDDRSAALALLESFREGVLGLASEEVRLLRLDGSIVEVEASAASFEWEGVRGALVFGRDISGRKRDERHRQQLEEQVRQAQKMESVGRLAGGIAHDFNNLLTVINGYSDIVLHSMPESDRNWNSLREIRDAGKRAALLTTQLLMFSRKDKNEPSVVEVNSAVREMERMLKRLVGDNFRIITELHPRVGSVLVDPSGLTQVLMNLVINARDAMPKGGSITIRTEPVTLEQSDCDAWPEARPGSFIRLGVSDTGVGIPPEIQARVFEPFFTTKESGQGTGLGLSMVYGIVHNAGGWLELKSKQGEGTTVLAWLPVLGIEPGPSAAGEPERTCTGHETILVVDDNRAVREATESMLRQYGYEVLGAESGEEALALLRENGGGIDLVLTDVRMPGMTGPHLIHVLRQLQPQLKSLFMSGYCPEDLQRHPGDPETPYIAKPFQPETLASHIRTTLDRK